MSAGGAMFAILTAVPLTFGATRRIHERLRARWQLRNHDPLDADAREGDLVFISGTVRPLDETLIAPLSGRACVAYRARATSTAQPLPSCETTQLRPFVVERDDGSSIVVAGERAIFGIAAQKLVPRNPDREASFLARHAMSKLRARFSEVAVELGAKVFIGGTLVLVPREAPPTGELLFRDLAPPDPQIVGNRESPLVIMSRDA